MGSAAVVFPAPEPAPARAPAGWQAPVAGELLRPFEPGAHPFARGAHRGIDLYARPGTLVGATCAGQVAFAGPVAGARVVTLACGGWRVTHLPLDRIAVVSGDGVRRGQPLGTVAAGSRHTGLHLGVRRTHDRFGYVDPWPLLAGGPGHPAFPLLAPRATQPRRGPLGTPRPSGQRLRHPRRRDSPARAPRLAPAPREVTGVPKPTAPAGERHHAPLAPPLAWLGLAVLLLGVVRSRPRSRMAHARLRAKEPATRTR